MKHLYTTTVLTPELWLCSAQYDIRMEGDGSAATEVSGDAQTGGEATATETATETAATGTEAEAAKTEAAAGTEAEAGKEEKPDKKPWFMERIDGLTRQKHATEARVQTLEQQNAALRTTLETLLAQGVSPEKAAAAVGEAAAALDEGNEPAKPAARQPAGPRLYTQAEIDALAANKAREMLAETNQTSAQEQFNIRCNEVAAEGKTKFGAEFDSAVATLNSAGVMQPSFLEAVTQLPEAAQILHQLGKSPEEAMRIANLPPIPMAVALARLTAAAPATVRPASTAPAPVTKINGHGSPPAPNLNDENLPIDQWFKLREEGIKARAH